MNDPKARGVAQDGTDTDALRNLGGAVRVRRKVLDLTLAEVAERTGLSVPFLSQIETSFAAPSLTSLFVIASALDTTPERLLAGPVPAEVVVTRRDEGQRYAVTDDDRPAQRRQLTGLGEPFSAAEYVVEPGMDLGGFYASRGRELLHVMTGSLIVDLVAGDGDDIVSHELSTGDLLMYPTSTRHRWRHAGRDTTRFLHVISAPA